MAMKTLGAESVKEAMSILSSSFPSPPQLNWGLGTKNGPEIDLFILDLWLPYGNGINFLKDVRENGNTAQAIIMSSVITEDVNKNRRARKRIKKTSPTLSRFYRDYALLKDGG